MRTLKYLNVSVRREERSHLAGSTVGEEEDKTNPKPTSCSKHYFDEGNSGQPCPCVELLPLENVTPSVA